MVQYIYARLSVLVVSNIEILGPCVVCYMDVSFCMKTYYTKTFVSNLMHFQGEMVHFLFLKGAPRSESVKVVLMEYNGCIKRIIIKINFTYNIILTLSLFSASFLNKKNLTTSPCKFIKFDT